MTSKTRAHKCATPSRDYPGSSLFSSTSVTANLLAFFHFTSLPPLLHFPGLDVGPYAEVLGRLHHCVISVEPARWNEIVRRLDDTGVKHVIHSDVSVYFRASTAPASSSSPTRSDRCTDTKCCDERPGHRDRRLARRGADASSRRAQSSSSSEGTYSSPSSPARS